MLPEIISFRKTFEQRLVEYEHLLENSNPCSTMNQLWADDLELEFDNLVKWQALWQPSKEICREFNVMYPSSVLVTVQEVIYNELSAIVLIEDLDEDTKFPGILHVPLFELYITKQQPFSSLPTAKNRADLLDRCRFFLLYLWYPWDNTDEVPISQWAEEHLENRLKLQCDIRGGLLDRATADYVQNLLKSSLQVSDAFENTVEDLKPSETHMLNTVRNLIDQEVIKAELKLMENPELRTTMASYVKTRRRVTNNFNVAIIIQSGLMLDALPSTAAFLERTRALLPHHAVINISCDVVTMLESLEPDGTVVLSAGTHSIKDLGALAYGGQIKGTQSFEETIIMPIEQSPPRYMFLTSYAPMLYQNLTIERDKGVHLWVRAGMARLENCRLVASGMNGLSRGVVVQPGCRLEMVNCRVECLDAAIVLKKGASAYIENCTITHCNQGIKMIEDFTVTLKSVTIEHCSQEGLVFETSSLQDVTRGNVDILKCPGLALDDCNFAFNATDAFINPLHQELTL